MLVDVISEARTFHDVMFQLWMLWNHLDPPGDGFVFCALFAVSVVGCMLGYSS